MMLWRGTIGARVTLSLLATAMFPVPSGALAQDQRSHRDEWQKVDEIVVALDLEEGERVADIGAGRGFFTLRLARVVGPAGRVFAVDIDEAVLEQLRASVRRAGLQNVETILSELDDPMLADTSVDAALMVIAYHEMREHEAMLAGVKRALRPGGRLAIVDNPVRDSTDSRRQQMRRHHIDIRIVEQDLIAAGFEILERLPRFIDVRDERHTHRNWMLVARPIDDHAVPQGSPRIDERGNTIPRVWSLAAHKAACRCATSGSGLVNVSVKIW
jgi:ubiquinone/menaquinone biosynthesis C-methylase UbiE